MLLSMVQFDCWLIFMHQYECDFLNEQTRPLGPPNPKPATKSSGPLSTQAFVPQRSYVLRKPCGAAAPRWTGDEVIYFLSNGGCGISVDDALHGERSETTGEADEVSFDGSSISLRYEVSICLQTWSILNNLSFSNSGLDTSLGVFRSVVFYFSRADKELIGLYD